MTEATTTAEVDKTADTADTTTKTAETTTQSTAAATTEAAKTSATTETAIDKGASGEAGKTDAKSSWGDNWREEMAGGDDDVAKAISRYGSPKGVARALREAQATISSGLKRAKPDPKDEKAMAEWRKAEGIPDDPTGYKLPEVVQKRLTDEDKPILSSFTEFAHAKGAKPEVVEIASEWYIDMMETIQAKQIEGDKIASEEAEDTLRKDWAHGEYKANTTIARRFIEGIPGVGAKWAEARIDGKRLGDMPEFIAWAADMGREKFGDVAFTSSDSESKHTARKTELETLMRTDIDKYFETGADKEYAAIIEKEMKRRK